MWWEERYWLLLDVEWEAGRQKQGSPGYCCSVGGYQQPGSPLSSRHCRWAEGAMDGTTFSLSLQLILHAPFLCLLSSFSSRFFLLPFRQHDLSLSSDISPCFFDSPSTLWVFLSLCPVPYHPPTPTLWS